MLFDIQNENIKIQKQLDDLDKEFTQIRKNIENQRVLLDQEKNRNALLKT